MIKDDHFKTLSAILAQVANEAILLAKFERIYLEDSLPQLFSSESYDDFEKEVNATIEHLGGPPKFYLLSENENPPLADNYPDAAIKEVVDVFLLAQKSILRTYMYLKGSSFLESNNDLLEGINASKENQESLMRSIQSTFWEHAEAAYIRLYSFWDRVGQIFDFAFFNIRKFDQNGFNSVMNRIHANVVPMVKQMQNDPNWKSLRTFQTSNKIDGLQWLLQRRNLIVHSLHLHPVPLEENVFDSQFNHLDGAHRNKLLPKEPSEEVVILIGQLRKAAELFPACLKIIMYSESRKYKS
ncbi:hypothetical protein SMX82_003970 [Cronobacter sakazakii]|nr:hypothetical protein [Cronobacter sakazakii]